MAYGRLELAALEYWARQGEIILLYQDETVLWRFALPPAEEYAWRCLFTERAIQALCTPVQQPTVFDVEAPVLT